MTGGVKAVLPLAWASAAALPVEIEARGGRAAAASSQARSDTDTKARPGRRHQRLLRARDDHVDPPLVGAQIDPAEARDRIDDERSARRAATAAAIAWMSCTTPVEVSDWVT